MTGKSAEQLTAERGMSIGGEALPNGQIHVATDFPLGTDGLVILDRMAHECQHVADFIAENKGGNAAVKEALSNLGKTLDDAMSSVAHERKYYDSTAFYNKCVEHYGIFPKGTPEYDEAVKLNEMHFRSTNIRDLTTAEAHDAMPFEQRAINREKEQINVFTQVSNKIGLFLNQFFA